MVKEYLFFSRASDGSLILASYCPRGCTTWHWSISICKSRVFRPWWIISRATIRTNQWHDYYRLPFGRSICVSRQNYHLRPTP